MLRNIIILIWKEKRNETGKTIENNYPVTKTTKNTDIVDKKLVTIEHHKIISLWDRLKRFSQVAFGKSSNRHLYSETKNLKNV